MAYKVLILLESHEAFGDISRTLEMAGLSIQKVYRSSTCQDALEILNEHQIDLTFVDHDLDISGKTAKEGWDRCSRELQRPMSVISHNGHRTMIEGLIIRGENKIFHKPVTSDVMEETVRKAIE